MTAMEKLQNIEDIKSVSFEELGFPLLQKVESRIVDQNSLTEIKLMILREKARFTGTLLKQALDVLLYCIFDTLGKTPTDMELCVAMDTVMRLQTDAALNVKVKHYDSNETSYYCRDDLMVRISLVKAEGKLMLNVYLYRDKVLTNLVIKDFAVEY